VRVLLTGSDGYLGAVMAPVLMARGHDVVGLDAGFYRDGRLYDPQTPAVQTVTRDIRHITADDLAGFDAVIHLAELSNDPLSQHNPALTYALNGDGSGSLARAAKAAGVRRFIYSSSCSVYGAGTGEWKTEESPVMPLTPYADCKLRNEALLASLADDSFAPTSMRNATAYGASPRMRFDIVLNQFAGFAWTTGRIVMNSDGSPWRPLVHTRDIAEAFACVLEAPIDIVHNQIFNVGSNDENYRVREIAEMTAAAFPGAETSFGPAGHDGRSYRVSFDKIASVLPAFRSQWTAAKGAAELREIFERVQMTGDTFNFRAFTRLAQLKHLLETKQLDEWLFWNKPTSAQEATVDKPTFAQEATVGKPAAA
jgi:nucleoside-diphosphate-sugar epimerase